MIRNAIISEGGRYRYALTREWGRGPRVLFIMLNPSTADAMQDDPTIRKCIGFAQRWGYSKLTVVNLYAYRATKPDDLWQAALDGVDIMGPKNATCIDTAASCANMIVAAWGAQVCNYPARKAGLSPPPEGYANEMLSRLKELKGQTLGLASCKQPRHPLMLAYATPLEAL